VQRPPQLGRYQAADLLRLRAIHVDHADSQRLLLLPSVVPHAIRASTRQDRTECTLARRLPVPAALRGVLRPRTRHELPALVTSVLAVDHRLVLVALPLGRDSTRCRAAA